MKSYSRGWLGRRIGLAVAALVAVAAATQFAFFHAHQMRAFRRDLEKIAATNAEFLRATGFPPSAALAADLGRMLQGEVFFVLGEGVIPGDADADLLRALPRLAADGAAAKLAGSRYAAAVKVDERLTFAVARRSPAVAPPWARPDYLASLAVLLLACFGVAGLLSRGVVLPLRALAARMPDLAGDAALGPLPGSGRPDDIGRLARALEETHERMRAERQLRAKAEQMAILGRMATGLAHEIQNPVAAVKMHAQLIDSAPAGRRGEQAEESAGHILDAAGRIESLVQQWMFLARPEPPRKAPARVGALVDAALARLAPQFDLAAVEIVRRIPGGASVTVDERRLTQVLVNVLANALQAMGGRGRLEIGAEARGDAMVLRIGDSGPGFSPEAKRRAAEMFYSEREGGMGVGLTVCDHIVRAHGGALAFANAPGGGAAVEIALPRGEAEP